jgi:outer membrane lipoprotein-sorting protein
MRRALLVAAVGAILACRAGGPPDLTPADELPAPGDLLATLRQRAAGRENLRALGRVTVLGPEGRVRLRAVLVAERPRSFRFETLTPFEQPIDVMTSNGERLWYLHEGRLYAGPATAENVARLLPLPLRPEEVVETFLGGVPISGRFEPERVEIEGDRYRLVLSGPGGEEGRLVVDPRTLRVRSAELRGATGAVRAAVELSSFTAAADGGPAVPTDIRVRVPPREVEVRLRLLDPETDVELPPGLFEMEAPGGAAPEPFP